MLHSKHHANVYIYYLNLKTLKATVNIICASYQHSALNSHFIACSAKMYLGRLSRFPVPVVKMLSSDSGGSGEALQGEGVGSRASLKGPQHWGFSSTRLAVQGPSRCSAALVHGGRQRAACPTTTLPSGFVAPPKGQNPWTAVQTTLEDTFLLYCINVSPQWLPCHPLSHSHALDLSSRDLLGPLFPLQTSGCSSHLLLLYSLELNSLHTSQSLVF